MYGCTILAVACLYPSQSERTGIPALAAKKLNR